MLKSYENAITKTCATPPYPPYHPNQVRTPAPFPQTASVTPKDTLYWLLQLYAATSPIPPLPIPSDEESEIDESVPVSHLIATPSSALPTNLLLSVVNPANLTQDPMDFSLAWHLYTVLRGVPGLSTVVDLQGFSSYRLHTSYHIYSMFMIVIS